VRIVTILRLTKFEREQITPITREIGNLTNTSSSLVDNGIRHAIDSVSCHGESDDNISTNNEPPAVSRAASNMDEPTRPLSYELEKKPKNNYSEFEDPWSQS